MILGRYRRRVRTSHARAAVDRSTNAAIPTRQRPRARVLWGGLTIVSVEDKAMAEMMCAWRTRGRSLQNLRSNCHAVGCCRGDGIVRAREGGDL